MNKFIKVSLLFAIPIFIILASYFILDPFKVLYKRNLSAPSVVILNRDFVSTEKYIQQNKKQKFNSFIFGSSRTLAFKTKNWTPSLDKNAKPFVFDASGETIYGIWKKIQFLHKTNAPIANALIIICPDVTFSMDSNYQDHIRIKHPRVSEESSLKFNNLFFKSYFSAAFFIKFLDYTLFHKKKPYMNSYLEFRTIYSDSITNDLYIDDQEKLILINKEKYYLDKKDIFYSRPDTVEIYPKQINKKMKTMLEEIKAIFNEFNTDYKIVISPLYNQTKLNSEDLEILKSIFGSSNIFDYSGKNSITESKYNYYENSHYRYHVGEQIMREIYSK